jgi:hypothetical protein
MKGSICPLFKWQLPYSWDVEVLYSTYTAGSFVQPNNEFTQVTSPTSISEGCTHAMQGQKSSRFRVKAKTDLIVPSLQSAQQTTTAHC